MRAWKHPCARAPDGIALTATRHIRSAGWWWTRRECRNRQRCVSSRGCWPVGNGDQRVESWNWHCNAHGHCKRQKQFAGGAGGFVVTGVSLMILMIPGAMGVAVLRMLLVNVAGAGFHRQMQRPQTAPACRDKGHGEECKQDSDGLGHGRWSVSNNAGRSTIVQPDWWRSLHLHSQHAPLRPF